MTKKLLDDITDDYLIAAVRQDDGEYEIVATANGIDMLMNCVLKACPNIEKADMMVLKIDHRIVIVKTGENKWNFEKLEA